jgi:hypothetical protein
VNGRGARFLFGVVSRVIVVCAISITVIPLLKAERIAKLYPVPTEGVSEANVDVNHDVPFPAGEFFPQRRSQFDGNVWCSKFAHLKCFGSPSKQYVLRNVEMRIPVFKLRRLIRVQYVHVGDQVDAFDRKLTNIGVDGREGQFLHLPKVLVQFRQVAVLPLVGQSYFDPRAIGFNERLSGNLGSVFRSLSLRVNLGELIAHDPPLALRVSRVDNARASYYEGEKEHPQFSDRDLKKPFLESRATGYVMQGCGFLSLSLIEIYVSSIQSCRHGAANPSNFLRGKFAAD